MKNLSLSSRIRRRNAAGFKGKGTNQTFKTKNFGDYRNPEDNHKHKDFNIITMINFLKKHTNMKHIGSKPYHLILRNYKLFTSN